MGDVSTRARVAPPASVMVSPVRAARQRGLVPLPEVGWQVFGWFGIALFVVGVSDILLAGYPFRLGNPDWEFGFIHQTFSALPLPTVGLAAVLGAAFARGRRRSVRGGALTLFLLVPILLALYLVFLTVIPVALQAAPEPVLPGVRKAILRTSVAGVVFPLTYLAAAVVAWRYSRRAAARPVARDGLARPRGRFLRLPWTGER